MSAPRKRVYAKTCLTLVHGTLAKISPRSDTVKPSRETAMQELGGLIVRRVSKALPNAELTGDWRQERARRVDAARRPCRTPS